MIIPRLSVDMPKLVKVYLDALEAADAEAPYVLRTRAESARRAWRLRAEMAPNIEFAGGTFQFLRTLASVAPTYYARRSLELPKEVPHVRQQCVYL